MDLSKDIKFSLEFVRRLIERSLISAFGNDIDKTCERIEWKIRNESILIKNPNRKYLGQSWCIINIEGVGLAKIPIEETPKCLKAITIACPVTDPRCVEPYKKRFIDGEK